MICQNPDVPKKVLPPSHHHSFYNSQNLYQMKLLKCCSVSGTEADLNARLYLHNRTFS